MIFSHTSVSGRFPSYLWAFLLLFLFPYSHPFFFFFVVFVHSGCDMRDEISITVIVFRAYLITVDLTAHVMISALFNSCSCNHFCFLKSSRLDVDVIRDLMTCDVVCRLAGSFLEQSGWALINRLIEESDRVWMQILLSVSFFLSLCFFVSLVSVFLSFSPCFHLIFGFLDGVFFYMCLSWLCSSYIFPMRSLQFSRLSSDFSFLCLCFLFPLWTDHYLCLWQMAPLLIFWIKGNIFVIKMSSFYIAHLHLSEEILICMQVRQKLI